MAEIQYSMLVYVFHAVHSPENKKRYVFGAFSYLWVLFQRVHHRVSIVAHTGQTLAPDKGEFAISNYTARCSKILLTDPSEHRAKHLSEPHTRIASYKNYPNKFHSVVNRF